MEQQPLSTEQIWKLFSNKLLSFLLDRVSDQQVAEDLLQETFIQIHKNLSNLEDEQKITAWILQITRNLLIDHHRIDHHRTKEMSASQLSDRDVYDFAPENDNYNINELVMGWLPMIIDQLPDNNRKAVRLYELNAVPPQEIADILNISLSGAKSRIKRGREKLKTIIFQCCSFEQDQHGNVIRFVRHSSEACHDCSSCEGC